MSDHIMLDLETLDTVATAGIVSIGAVIFQGPNAGRTFYQAVNTCSWGELGLTSSPATVAWWSSQSPEARAVFTDPQRVPLHEALANFSAFVPDGAKMWGNGASFDNAILAHAYRAVGMNLPWKFWDDRCYRTLAASIPQKRVQSGVHHNSLDDAISQADHMLMYADPRLIA